VCCFANKRRCVFAAIIGSLLYLPPALGGVSLGEPECGAWLTTPSSDAKAWVLGYLSGMNLVWRAEQKLPAEPLAALSSPEEVFSWMDTYCRANPRRSLGRGGIILFFEFVKRKEAR